MLTDKEAFQRAFIDKLQTAQGKSLAEASKLDLYMAVAGVMRDYMARKWIKTNDRYYNKDEREVYYFSLEFLLGKMLSTNLLNLGKRTVVQESLQELGIALTELEEFESDAGLGNGGLGRLAACFLDSLASLELPGHGCGIRYRYGLFEQRIINGHQVELPDNWLKDGNAWEFRKADKAVEVHFGGSVRVEEGQGRLFFYHEDYETVVAVPYDIPIAGYKNNTVNTLRLWSAETPHKDFDFSSFSRGEYLKAVEHKFNVEAISQVLYPDDKHYEGRLLRLKQQYFFVSAGIQSIIRRYKKHHHHLRDFHEHVAIHINDTHPVLAIPELMRILMDIEGMGWDEAWKITSNTISYTNHTILAEALEKWPVDMFKQLLPRIYMIVHEINERFCSELFQRLAGNLEQIAQMAIIAHGQINMAHLAIVGSHSVNGVAKLHTEILKKQVMKSFYDQCPNKFSNKTNGITHRRWLLQCNPGLAQLVTELLGNTWIKHPLDLTGLLDYTEDTQVLQRLAAIKSDNKQKLAQLIYQQQGVVVDPNSIFDVQVKRLHAYKRQLLNVLHIMDLYNRLRENPALEITPRTFIFGAKASPGYHQAKLTIKLINTLADKINADQTIQDKLKVVFLENYRVSLAEKIIPAADVSEQISTASKEASGTGNMKFMLNGAVTIGTLDGANVEIKEEVGQDNIFIFGLTAPEVLNYYQKGGYHSWDFYHSDQRIKLVMDQLVNGFLSDSQEEFRPLYEALLNHNDEFFVLRDFASYADTQARLDQSYRKERQWQRMCLTNIAHAGLFSSDRTISEYATAIWRIHPVHVE